MKEKILHILLLPFKIVFSMIKGFFTYHIKECWNKKNIFHLDNFIASILVFGAFFLIGKATEKINFFDPISDAFSDVELTDLAFSRLEKNKKLRDDEQSVVTIVNIGHIPRQGIAILIDSINKYNPKAIGIDAFLRADKGFATDAPLMAAIMNTKNCVMVTEAKNFNPEDNSCDSLSRSNHKFSDNSFSGCATMDINENSEGENASILRHFFTFIKNKKDSTIEPSFAVKLCELYDSTSMTKLKKRNKLRERINYAGNIRVYGYKEKYSHLTNYKPLEKKQYFKAIDYNNIFEGDFSGEDYFKNKIVLLGFIGDPIYLSTGVDKFYTPLNNKYVGKTPKDMYGVVTHANIISTILNRNYISETPSWLKHIFGILAVWFTFVNFRPLYHNHKIWYDGVSKVLSFGYTLFILLLIGIVFDIFNYEIHFGSIYFACILLAGDFLEIYYGMLKNIVRKYIFSNISQYEEED